MKYLIALLLGLLSGVAALAALLVYNPLAEKTVSPLSVATGDILYLAYSPVVDDAIAYTNSGETRIEPKPEKVLQLWEAPVRNSRVLVTPLRDSSKAVIGLGIKFSSDSESTRLLQGKALVNSAWHIYLPARGSVFVGQEENYWNYLREIVVPAYLNSADSWKGNWTGILSSGPGALGTAHVVGGSGEFAGLNTIASESAFAKAWSTERGLVAADAQLLIELPDVVLSDSEPGPP